MANAVIHIRDLDPGRKVTLKVHGLEADAPSMAAANHLLKVAGRLAGVNVVIEDAEGGVAFAADYAKEMEASLDRAIVVCLQEVASTDEYKAFVAEGRSVIDKINAALKDGAKLQT
jgi:purine nucleoside permease